MPQANAFILLFAERTIPGPVPRVRFVSRQWNFLSLIAMDCIPGSTLSNVWRKVYVAYTLRRYVRQLLRLKASATTPPDLSESHIFCQVQSHRDPFASYFDLSIFFNDRHQSPPVAMYARKVPRDVRSRNDLFDDYRRLVLTHQDLNIIVGNDGSLIGHGQDNIRRGLRCSDGEDQRNERHMVEVFALKRSEERVKSQGAVLV